MEGEGRWSSEALQAMDTHLWLLQRANRCETDGDAMGGPASNKDGGGGRAKPAYVSGQCKMAMGPHLDLNSHLPLPHGWEQFLDLQTGQVYYIDWMRCRRSYMDPRMLLLEHDDVNDSDVSECMSDADTCHASNLHDIMEINTKLITSPLLQEDWNLMEVRGWMSLDSDDQSEITCEITTPNQVFNVLERNSPKLVIKEKSLLL